MRQREEARKHLSMLMAEDISATIRRDEDGDGRILSAITEKAIGKEGSEKLKKALARVGGDLAQEGGFRFFRRLGKEREFNPVWLKNVKWLKDLKFEGISFRALGLR